MRINKLNTKAKTLLTIDDIAKTLSISIESARVTANRYVKSGLLIRVKRNLYITATKYLDLKETELFQIANFIETPSYISLTSALSYYGISTQQLQNIIESISWKRTKTSKAPNIEFKFYKVKQSLYSNFSLNEIFFIASAEKALSDAIYLTAIGKYQCDFDAIDFKKIDPVSVSEIIKSTNDLTINFWNKLCKRYKI